VLQHGSFVVDRDVEAESAVFMLSDEARSELSRTTATLSSALGSRPTREAIAEAVVRGVERTLGVRLELAEFQPDELEAARSWVAEHELLTAPRNT
jgi:lipoate-protein ligase A